MPSERKNYNVDAKDFVRIWNSSANSDEATRRVSELAGQDVPREIVVSRAAHHRKQGVRLKMMPRQHRKRVDVEALNQIADAALTP
jgi:hypothetical protein